MKKRLLYLPIFLMTMSLCGCSPQLTTQNYTHEAGESLPTEVTTYATFEKPEKAAEAVLNMDSVDPNKVGTYEAVITLKNKEYPFTVEVVDTTAPEGTFSTLVAVAGIDDKITGESFNAKYEDASDFVMGFRNAELIKDEAQVKECFSFLQNAGGGEVNLEEILGVEWNQETDTWTETDVATESIEQEFVPEESGLYKTELVVADISGNAEVSSCYVLSDLIAPEFTKADDITVKAINHFEAYYKHRMDDLNAEDNMIGDITNGIILNRWEEVESTDTGAKIRYEFSATDIAGNETKIERFMNVKYQVNGGNYTTPGTTVEVAVSNGHDRARAEEAFAKVNEQRVAAGLNALVWDENIYQVAAMRAEEILSNYSHTRSTTGRTTVEDYSMGENLNKLWGDTSAEAAVKSWMNSPTHRDNLLINYYNRTAVACYQNGKYCYYVQLFDQ